MDRLMKDRSVLRRAFTKICSKLEASLANKTATRDIQVNWKMLVEKNDALRIADREIYNMLLEQDADEDTLNKEMDGADEYYCRFVNVSVEYENFFNVNDESASVDIERGTTANSVAPTSVGSQSVPVRKYRLPLIEFKKFGGDVREWLTFWSQFKKINEDTNLDSEDKFQYLIQATVPGSRARELVESFPPTGENYEKAVDSLKSRFGRDDFLIEVYVRELLKLVLSNTLANQPKMSLSTLYDRIETQLRALETLGITTDICAAMLYPLVESCLPEELIRVWQRSPRFSEEKDGTMKTRLNNLISFLKSEVENEERISLAVEGFGMNAADSKVKKNKQKPVETSIPTAAGLISTQITKCIFCDNNHNSQDCFKMRKLTLQEKQKVLAQKKACFRCMKVGHQSRRCHERLQCIICGGKHVVQLCPELPVKTKGDTRSSPSEQTEDNNASVGQALANRTDGSVFLQTLRVKLQGDRVVREVRAIIDSGSQRSYILRTTAKQLQFPIKGEETIMHALFGGTNSSTQRHLRHEIKIMRMDGQYSCAMEVLDQPVICGDIPAISKGPWTQELHTLGISLSDTKGEGPIELLIGADVAGKLLTGQRKVLKSGLVAIETLFGWTIMGKTSESCENTSSTMLVTSLFSKDISLSQLWELDVLGIKDPVVQRSQEERFATAREFFSNTTTIDREGRYEVRLPWLEEHPSLPDNYMLSKKRMESVMKRLKGQGLQDTYTEIFKEWLAAGIIEEVSTNEFNNGFHYLPHRPVIKENSLTTRVRPVFDASAKEKDMPSLNQCLEKGENLIELIPSILLKFRREKLGVVSDIRKAFLQISVHPNDRNYLRFLWQDNEGNERIYRHKRVVFGVNCSPFLLGATIAHHIEASINETPEEDVCSKKVLEKLRNSFYVDNCVTSVNEVQELENFIQKSTVIMAKAKFELRGWEFTDSTLDNNADTPVLGLTWNKKQDTLSIGRTCFENNPPAILTKRAILSMTQRVFDPIGFSSPVTIVPKILLQTLWTAGVKWDDEVDEEHKRRFLKWYKEFHLLQQIKIPRWILLTADDVQGISMHVFCDASQHAYAAVLFLRILKRDSVDVRLLQAKARVAPIKKISIPRLELLAATIASRLFHAVKKDFPSDISYFFWSDSTTVLSWIKRTEEWNVFVRNRVKEIRSLTSPELWRHVPGHLNPADLPSRGCSGLQLYESKWWEGPNWLHRSQTDWPREEMLYDEEEINKERKKTATVMIVQTEMAWYGSYFSKFCRNVRQMGWILRFIHNSRYPEDRRMGELTAPEMDIAEKTIIKCIQQDCLQDDKQLKSLNCFVDEGLIRVRTKISNRKDAEDFRHPLVLPANHPLVNQLIHETHVQACHVGVQGLLSLLREHYWILGGRRTLRKVLSKCVPCKRQNSRKIEVVSPPLPLNRVRDALVFEVTGVDLAGPLFIREGKKAWICLFTCAVYRAIHLELSTSLSTDHFIQALRRFIARRGRPSTIYSDNGTNFVGTENCFNKINWEDIKRYSAVHKIDWKFNPPTAAWWGGWWERLIGIVKPMLRKTLGHASLSYEELETVLCDTENIVNSRPLTYMPEDPNDLTPLTPAMFLRDLPEAGVPDCDQIDSTSLNRRNRYRQKLRKMLRQRFRSEYLGQLKWISGTQKNTNAIKIGDIVLVGSDGNKRLDWPLGRVIELLPGADNLVRLVRVKTKNGPLIRPVQRIYPLECQQFKIESAVVTKEQEKEENCEPKLELKSAQEEKIECNRVTRSGRLVKPPKRLNI